MHKKNLSQSPKLDQILRTKDSRRQSAKRQSLYQTMTQEEEQEGEKIEKHFCRKYSRIKMDQDDVF